MEMSAPCNALSASCGGETLRREDGKDDRGEETNEEDVSMYVCVRVRQLRT